MPEFAVGDQVSHPFMGRGTVRRILPGYMEPTLVIDWHSPAPTHFCPSALKKVTDA